MARRSPAEARANAPRRSRRSRIPDGISPRGRACIARLIRTRPWLSTIDDALRALAWFERDPTRLLRDPRDGCGALGCCPDPDEAHRVLEIVAHALPPRDARILRRRASVLDPTR